MVEEKVEHYSGVVCLCCRQPIALTAAVVKHGEEFSELPHVFTLRCKACDKERPYRRDDVSSFEGAPRHREVRAGLARLQRGGLARAANA